MVVQVAGTHNDHCWAGTCTVDISLSCPSCGLDGSHNSQASLVAMHTTFSSAISDQQQQHSKGSGQRQLDAAKLGELRLGVGDFYLD